MVKGSLLEEIGRIEDRPATGLNRLEDLLSPDGAAVKKNVILPGDLLPLRGLTTSVGSSNGLSRSREDVSRHW